MYVINGRRAQIARADFYHRLIGLLHGALLVFGGERLTRTRGSYDRTKYFV